MSKVETKVVDELTITMDFRHGWCDYVGTKAAIEAEGVVPRDIEWPEGFQEIGWILDGLTFRLKRQRPKGVKGPRSAFKDCDNWALYWRYDSFGSDERQAALAELHRDEAVFYATPQGLDRAKRDHVLYCQAGRDKPFQDFLKLVVGGARG